MADVTCYLIISKKIKCQSHYSYFNLPLGASLGKGITAFHSDNTMPLNIVTHTNTFRTAFDASILINKQLTKCGDFTHEAMKEILQQGLTAFYILSFRT